MLKKKERLTKEQFDHFFKVGFRVHSPSVQIIVANSPTFHGCVVVGKKVYKKAVDRNKLRRRLYAMLYNYAKQSALKKTFIVVAKPPITKLTKTALHTEFIEALAKATSL